MNSSIDTLPKETKSGTSYDLEWALNDEKITSDKSDTFGRYGVSENPNENDENLSNGLKKVLSRVVSRTSVVNPGPPPNGGLVAWTQAVIGHIIVFNTWGYINSFGVFQTYYVTALNHPPSDIAWVGSVQIFLLFLVGTFSGRATDAGYFRQVFIIGSIFQLLGVFMTSLSTEYWQLFLAQGICTGLGSGLLFTPSLALLATYFTTKRSVAIAIAAAGSATGGMVYPAMVSALLNRLGFAWTMRTLGFLMLGLQLLAIAFAKPRLPPRRTGPLIEWAAFQELPYLLFTIGMFLVFWGLYFGFYYIGYYAVSILGTSETVSINLLLVLNGVGLIGRILPAVLADQYFGPMNMIIPCSLIAGIILYCWVAVKDVGGLYIFAVFYGIFGSSLASLFPATLSSLTTDITKTGIRLGMVFSIVSFATLTGTPIAGALIQTMGGAYLDAQMFAATVMVAGCVFLMAARISKTGFRFRVRM